MIGPRGTDVAPNLPQDVTRIGTIGIGGRGPGKDDRILDGAESHTRPTRGGDQNPHPEASAESP